MVSVALRVTGRVSLPFFAIYAGSSFPKILENLESLPLTGDFITILFNSPTFFRFPRGFFLTPKCTRLSRPPTLPTTTREKSCLSRFYSSSLLLLLPTSTPISFHSLMSHPYPVSTSSGSSHSEGSYASSSGRSSPETPSPSPSFHPAPVSNYYLKANYDSPPLSSSTNKANHYDNPQ